MLRTNSGASWLSGVSRWPHLLAFERLMSGDVKSRAMTLQRGPSRIWLLRGILLAMTGVAVLSRLHAQTSQPTVSLEVVSIKPSAPDCTLVMIGPSDDGFHLHCLTFQQLVRYAYGLNLSEESNVVGLPKWAINDHFDLDAPIRVDDLPRFEQLPPPEKARLLRSTLEDRFALRSHPEQWELPVYALVKGKTVKLKPTDPHLATKPTLLSRRNHITGNHCTMGELANWISPLQGRKVIDRTEITGHYDFSLDFAPETASPPAAEDAPSIFTAVQEQLGLRLISDKGMVTVLVVDSVNHPDPN